MTKGTQWRIVADYWAGMRPDAIAAKYQCDRTYPQRIARRRGFIRLQPVTLPRLLQQRKNRRA